VSIKYRGDVEDRVSDNTNLKIGFSRVGTKDEKGTFNYILK